MRTLTLSALALAVALFAADAGRTDDPPAREHHAGAAHDKCAAACGECQRACDSCATHCAHMLEQGKKDHMASLRSCQDCATTCSAAACIVARHGPFGDTICKACADACARCGKECEKFPDDQHMKTCADECRKCEQACKDMLTHMRTGGTASAPGQ